MSSKPQKLAGYPLPELTEVEETQSFCITIPAGIEFREAAYAQLTELGKWWWWKRDELRDTAATEAATTWRTLFNFEENCGGFLMTPEEYYDAHKRATYDAWNDIAKQVVSGRTTDIAVGSDGTVTDPTTGTPTAELPVDDPLTPRDETLEAKSGGASAIRLGCNLIWSQMLTWNAAGITAAETKTRLKQLYTMDDIQTDLFVDQYYADVTASLPVPSSWSTTLDSYMFCKGQTLQQMARFVYSAVAVNLQAISSRLVDALTQTQLNTWFEMGMQVPSTDYVDYACTKTPTETILVNIGTNEYFQGVQTWKINHRVRFTVTGSAVDAQGDLIDFWWNKAPTTAPTFKNNDTQVQVNAADQDDASTNEVPYNTSHAYTWTSLLNVGGLMRIRVNRGSIIDPALNYTFSVLVEDLGEVLT